MWFHSPAGFAAFLDEAVERACAKLDEEIKKKTTSGTTLCVCFVRFGEKKIFLGGSRQETFFQS